MDTYPITAMPALPNDKYRCDGLLPRVVRNENGKPVLAYLIDCLIREACARHAQTERDDPHAPAGTYSYTSHQHAPGDACPDFIRD